MSVSFNVGLAGVSVRIKRVLSLTASRTAAGSAEFTNVNSTPKRFSTCVQRR